MQSFLDSAGDWNLVEFDGAAVLGDDVTTHTRYMFLKSFRLTFPVLVYRYAVGGNVGSIVFMSKVPTGLTQSEYLTKSNCVIEELKPKLPQYHTRQMHRAFAEHCSNLASITSAARRFLYSSLTGDTSAPETSRLRDLDYRVKLVALGELPELAADLRHLNDGQPGRYNEFLGILQGMVRDFMAEDDRRHGGAHMSHFISVRDLHERATEKCSATVKIPSLDWLRLQFQPKSSRAATALRYNGKLDIRYAVQLRQLRSAHPDDHYCSALFKMQRAMCVEHREHSCFVCLDDKAKVPVGEPDKPMSSGVRGRSSLMAAGSTPMALDHDQASKGSLTPSVVLQCDVPESLTGSFYNGQLHVLVKDSVLQPSTPLRHATELFNLLKTSPKPLLFAFTDGGGDHSTTFLSVQLAWILLFLALDLDMLVACRTAPGHSYVNPAERCMSTLNLALQNCALARKEQDESSEKRLKTCNSMDAIRKQQQVVQDAWSASVLPVQKAVERRFNRLLYTGNQVQVHEPVSSEEIAEFCQKASNVDATIDCSNSAPTQADLKDKEGLAEFLRTHCRQRHYSFQIKKCNEDVCPLDLCSAPRLPRDVFQELSWLPDPVICEARPEHYMQYADVKGRSTDDTSRPSLVEKACRSLTEEQGCDSSMFTAQRVRSTVECTECCKPRCLFSKTSLSAGEREQLEKEMEQLEYSCGSPILEPDSSLSNKVFVRLALKCSDHVEFSYYSSKLNVHGICCYCGSDDASKPQEMICKFSTVLPICEDCRKCKEVIARMPKAGSKRKHPGNN